MNTPNAARSSRINPAHVFLAVGLLAILVSFMFRPVGANARLATNVLVYEDSSSSSTVKTVDLHDPKAFKFQVVPEGKGQKPKETTLNGVAIVDILKEAYPDLDLSKVPYVKVRRNADKAAPDDSQMTLLWLHGTKPESPSIVLDSGRRPNGGIFTGPSLVPGIIEWPDGQNDREFIREQQVVPFDAKSDRMRIIPGKGQILQVSVGKLRDLTGGERRLKAQVSGTRPKGDATYTWYGFGAGGTLERKSGDRSQYDTQGTVGQTQKQFVNVVVEYPDGSTGIGSYKWTSKKKDDGATKDPNPTGPTGAPGSSPATTVPGATPGPAVTPAPSAQPVPSTPTTPATPAPTTPTPTSETTQPTPETSSSVPDTSGILTLAKNVNNSGGTLQTVSGILLLDAAANPASPGGAGGSTSGPVGDPFNKLQQSVQSLASSIFQPVTDPRALWPYLIALLFALGFSGAVREWINP